MSYQGCRALTFALARLSCKKMGSGHRMMDRHMPQQRIIRSPAVAAMADRAAFEKKLGLGNLRLCGRCHTLKVSYRRVPRTAQSHFV